MKRNIFSKQQNTNRSARPHMTALGAWMIATVQRLITRLQTGGCFLRTVQLKLCSQLNINMRENG